MGRGRRAAVPMRGGILQVLKVEDFGTKGGGGCWAHKAGDGSAKVNGWMNGWVDRWKGTYDMVGIVEMN